MLSDNLKLIVENSEDIDVPALMNVTNEILEKSRNETNLCNMLLMMKKDTESLYAHSINVSILCQILAKWSGSTPKEIENVAIAGLLHDVGILKFPEEMRKDFTLPSKYLFKLGMEPWKPNAVKNTGLAEIIKALSIGIAIKLSNLMFGNINASTKIKAAIITKNKTRLILSTLWVPMTIKLPKKMVNTSTAILFMVSLSPMAGSKSINKEPPPLT